MSVSLYDKAVLDKLYKWGLNNSSTILAPDDIQNLYEVYSDKTNDKELVLPLICLNRNGNFTIQNVNKQPLSLNALTISRNRNHLETLNAIPIEIDYQLDIFTRKRAQADEYARELTFNFINYPELSIEIPYEGTNYVHNSTIILNGEVQDNSSIPERLIHGQFTRYTMTFKIINAYLFDVRIRDTIQGVEAKTIVDNEEDVKMEVRARKKNDD